MTAGLAVLTVAWFPPTGPDSGERVRMRALAEQLADQPGIASSTVFSFSDDRPREPAGVVRDERAPMVVPYRFDARAKVRATVTWRSLHEVLLATPATRGALAAALAGLRPDVVLVHGLPAWPLIPPPWWSRCILDSQNAEALRLARKGAAAPLASRPLLAQQRVLAQRLERRISARAAQVWCCSPEDRDYYRGLGADAVVVPNGTTLPPVRWTNAASPDRPVRLLSLSSLDYSANVDALRWFHDVWAPASRTPWTLTVVGSGDAGPVRRLFADDPRVTVVGRVEEVGTSYAEHDCLLVPLREGGGSRLKVVEGLGHGIPVLSTRVGVEGLGLQPGVDYLPADDAAGFEAALAGIRARPSSLDEVSARGREVAARFDWALIAREAAPHLLRVAAAAGPGAAASPQPARGGGSVS